MTSVNGTAQTQSPRLLEAGQATTAPGTGTTGALAAHRPGQRPIVLVDANALIGDAVRFSTSRPCLLPYLAQRGEIRMISSAHIDEKVYLRLPKACRNAGADLDTVTGIYKETYRPLLRLVEAGELAADDPGVCAVRLRDKEDAPLAQLAVLLAPSLVLTRDRDLHDYGFGSDNYGDQLKLVNGLVALDDQLSGAVEGVVRATALIAMGIQGLINLLRRSELMMAVTVGLSLVFGCHYRDRLREMPGAVKRRRGPILEEVSQRTGAAFLEWQEAQASVETHLVTAPSTSLESEVARILAQNREPAGATGIYGELTTYSRREQITDRDLKDMMWAQPAFEFVVGCGWTLGHPCH